MAPQESAGVDFDVDYVISYRIPSDCREVSHTYWPACLTLHTAKIQAAEQFKKLIRALTNAGLQTEVRNGDESSLLVFVRAADEKIFADVVYRSRSVLRIGNGIFD
jgi:hypothetical protein